FLAGIGAARCLVGRGLEMRVAEAAIAAREQHQLLADFGEVGDQRLAILLEHLGTHRHLEDRIFALGAVAILAHAVMAGLSLEVLLVAVVDQRVEAIDAADDDIAPASAIAAIGAAELDEFLAQERYRAGTAIAGTD